MADCLRFLTLLSLMVFSAFSFATDQYAVTYERNVEVKMRDGVTLRADIFRPQADGKFPVLLQRTPYNKDNGVDFGLKGAARGYVVIFEDVRGRYASEGEWYTFKNEPNDGYDTIEWAAALPYSNGKVGMFGGSYVGAALPVAVRPARGTMDKWRTQRRMPLPRLPSRRSLNASSVSKERTEG